LCALFKKSDKNKFHIFFVLTSKTREFFEKLRKAFFDNVFVSSFRLRSKNQAKNKRIKICYFENNSSTERNIRTMTFYCLLIQKNDVYWTQLQRKQIKNARNNENVQIITTLRQKCKVLNFNNHRLCQFAHVSHHQNSQQKKSQMMKKISKIWFFY
jgi:hypothetical protein